MVIARSVARAKGAGPSRLIITAKTARGEPFTREVEVALPEESAEAQGLERLWAWVRTNRGLFEANLPIGGMLKTEPTEARAAAAVSILARERA